MNEEEEFEFRLRLEKERSMQAMMEQPEQAQSFPNALKESFKQVAAPIRTAAEKLQPKNLTGLLPVAGGMAGTAVMPGAGTAAGAGLGSIAQKMANMVYGTSPQVEPTTSVAGIPLAPKEAINPMLNAALAGAPETQEGQAAAKYIGNKYEAFKPGIKKALSQVGQMMTGKSAVKVRRLIEDPAAILPESLGGAKSVSDASSAYGKALENTSVQHEGEQFVTKGLEKKAFGPFKRGHQEAEDVAQTVYDKWKNSEPIDAQEAFNAKRATDKLWPTVVKERNAEDIRQMSEFKTAMDDILSKQAGPFAKASKDYARARLGADFTQILPRTKTGDISTVKSLLMPMLEPKKIPLMMFTSPMATGVGNLAAQGAMKGINVLGRDPNIRQALMGVLQQIISGKKPSQ